MQRSHIALFSHTGQEIYDLAQILGKWPDVIVTNERPKDKRQIYPELEATGRFLEVPNRPTEETLDCVFSTFENPIITLHGWMRIMPPGLCWKYNMYNLHPAPLHYPEYEFLKGQDPQQRAWEANCKKIGTVIHRVTAGVDEGKILYANEYTVQDRLTLDETFTILRQLSLDLWVQFWHDTEKNSARRLV